MKKLMLSILVSLFALTGYAVAKPFDCDLVKEALQYENLTNACVSIDAGRFEINNFMGVAPRWHYERIVGDIETTMFGGSLNGVWKTIHDGFEYMYAAEKGDVRFAALVNRLNKGKITFVYAGPGVTLGKEQKVDAPVKQKPVPSVKLVKRFKCDTVFDVDPLYCIDIRYNSMVVKHLKKSIKAFGSYQAIVEIFEKYLYSAPLNGTWNGKAYAAKAPGFTFKVEVENDDDEDDMLMYLQHIED